ncbi:MAG TPA: c-type cytochrome [Fluviicola sp.]|nr:c-type cytochrome [Fluviicola sp.]
MNGFRFSYLLALLLFGVTILAVSCGPDAVEKVTPVEEPEEEDTTAYLAPDTSAIPNDEFGDLVRYGRDLVQNTAYYLGPEGVKGKYLGNKMNCTNCHLDAGTRPYGLNFLSTHGRYPQYRARENRILSLAERVNNCIERPHNGIPMPLDSREMNAIISYIKWLGEGIPVNGRVEGDKGIELKLPDYQLDVNHGKAVYKQECARCHGEDGQGKMLANNVTYEYPPLWGKQSYQPGSSLFRIIKAAQFIKANMPHDQVNWQKMKLSDRDALDVAAYINSEQHVRPQKEGLDYPDIKTKPIDYPFGPYNDTFTETQHKYGPYPPIIEYRKKKGLYVNY